MKSAKSERRYYGHVKKGMCVRCCEPARAGKTECLKHSEITNIKNNKNNAAYCKLYIETRHCSRCGKKLDEADKKVCFNCSHNDTRNNMRLKNYAAL